MLIVNSFEEYIQELRKYCESKYRLRKTVEDDYTGLHLHFKNGYEIQFDNSRLLNSYELVRSGEVSAEKSIDRIGNTIDRGVQEYWLNNITPKNSEKQKRKFFR